MGQVRIRGALLAALVLVAVACGGSPAAGTNDPAGAVQAAMSAISSGGVSKMVDYACAAKKGDIASAFGGGNLGGLESAGVKMDDLLNAMSMKFENVATKEVSKTDTTATVHVTADMTMTFDKEKMRAIMKTVLAAQGQPVDDTIVDAALNAMTGQLTQTQKLDEDLTVVNENGKWLICE
ncbi:MAG TPA: hypothetical protein VK194_06800 [Candidatus Deferrimicrobium sp.]|nr:hypothetical protein [Candidatus Deferrimicrobium sp.]